MVADYNVARHGSAEDASNLLCCSRTDYAETFLIPALINALERIAYLESYIRKDTPQQGGDKR